MYRRNRRAFFGVRLIVTLGVCIAVGVLGAKESKERVTKGSTEIYIERLASALDLGDLEGMKLPDAYKASDTEYYLSVPDSYDAGRPCPMILSVSPAPQAEIMFRSWQEVARKHGVIFACPYNAGNRVDSRIRGQRVVDTLVDVRAKYNVDPKHIYVSGFSGGARISTGLVKAFPDLFAGHIPMGAMSGGIGRMIRIDITTLKPRLGIYLFAGEKCMNRREMELLAERLAEKKVPHKLMIGTGMGHEIATPKQGLEIYEWFLARHEEQASPTKGKVQDAEKAQPK